MTAAYGVAHCDMCDDRMSAHAYCRGCNRAQCPTDELCGCEYVGYRRCDGCDVTARLFTGDGGATYCRPCWGGIWQHGHAWHYVSEVESAERWNADRLSRMARDFRVAIDAVPAVTAPTRVMGTGGGCTALAAGLLGMAEPFDRFNHHWTPYVPCHRFYIMVTSEDWATVPEPAAEWLTVGLYDNHADHSEPLDYIETRNHPETVAAIVADMGDRLAHALTEGCDYVC